MKTLTKPSAQAEEPQDALHCRPASAPLRPLGGSSTSQKLEQTFATRLSLLTRGYSSRRIENVCSHKNLYTNMCSIFIRNCPKLFRSNPNTRLRGNGWTRRGSLCGAHSAIQGANYPNLQQRARASDARAR